MSHAGAEARARRRIGPVLFSLIVGVMAFGALGSPADASSAFLPVEAEHAFSSGTLAVGEPEEFTVSPPERASEVVLQVTGSTPNGAGEIQFCGGDCSAPGRFHIGNERQLAGVVRVPLNGDTITLVSNAVAAIAVDVVGYSVPAGTPGSGTFVPADDGQAAVQEVVIEPDSSSPLALADVPPDAVGAVMTVALEPPSVSGYISACASTQEEASCRETSLVALEPGERRTATALAKLGPSGALRLYSGGGTAMGEVSVLGWVVESADGVPLDEVIANAVSRSEVVDVVPESDADVRKYEAEPASPEPGVADELSLALPSRSHDRTGEPGPTQPMPSDIAPEAATEADAEPNNEPTTEPTTEPDTEPTTEPTAEPDAELSPEPDAESEEPESVDADGLTTIDGDMTITEAGAVVDGVDVRGRIIVRAPNVVIKNSVIRGGSNPSGGLVMSESTGLLVVDTEIAAEFPTPNVNGIMGSNFTLERVNIHSVIDPVHIFGAGNVAIRGSWLHDNLHYVNDPNWSGGPSHDDSVQIQSGSNITITGSVLEGATNAAVMITQDRGAVSGVSISNNTIAGGACSINIAEKSYGPLQAVSIKDNVFRMDQGIAGCAVIRKETSPIEIVGNTWSDGSVVNASRG